VREGEESEGGYSEGGERVREGEGGRRVEEEGIEGEGRE
jgi:hypothetical protein